MRAELSGVTGVDRRRRSSNGAAMGQSGIPLVCGPGRKPGAGSARLADAGIGTGIHYPIPLHLQRAYRNLGYKRGDFPVCEAAALEILSLPMYPGLGHEQQGRVASELGAAVSLGRTSAMAVAVGAGSY